MQSKGLTAVVELDTPDMAKRQMSLGDAFVQNRLGVLADRGLVPYSDAQTTSAAQLLTSSEDGKTNIEEYEAMLNSPATGLERVGLPRSTSIIEKLTNVTYQSVDQEDDAKLV